VVCLVCPVVLGPWGLGLLFCLVTLLAHFIFLEFNKPLNSDPHLTCAPLAHLCAVDTPNCIRHIWDWEMGLVDLMVLILVFDLTDNGWSVFALCVLFGLSFGAGAGLAVLSGSLACSFHLVGVGVSDVRIVKLLVALFEL